MKTTAMKKILALALAVLMVMPAMAMAASADVAVYTEYADADVGELLYAVDFDSTADGFAFEDGRTTSWRKTGAQVSDDGSSVTFGVTDITPDSTSNLPKGARYWTQLTEYPVAGKSFTIEFTIDSEAPVGIILDCGAGFIINPKKNQTSIGSYGDVGGIGLNETYDGTGESRQTYAIELCCADTLAKNRDNLDTYFPTVYKLYVKDEATGTYKFIREVSEDKANWFEWEPGGWECLYVGVERYSSSDYDSKTSTVSDFNIYKGIGFIPSLNLIDGAQVRTKDPAGIRFTGIIGQNYLDGLKAQYGADNVKTGIIITPTDYLKDNSLDFTKEALDACEAITGTKYLDIEATTILTEGSYYRVNCAMINIKEKNINREFSAIFYVKITDGDTTTYTYSAYNEEDNSRSISYVATLALADVKDESTGEYVNPVTVYGQQKYSPYDADERATLEGFSSKASVTLMTYNIASGNDEVYNTIANASPDVICLQEDNSTSINAIKNKGYAALESDPSGSDEFNAILYKSSKFSVANAGGTMFYKELKNNYLDNEAVSAADLDMDRENRFFRWAILEDANGVQYLVVNTHLHYREGAKNEWPDYYDNDAQSDANKAVRVAQITLLKLWLSEQTVENQIVVGDMNCHYTSNEYKIFTSGDGALDSVRDNAIFKGDVNGTLASNNTDRDNYENGGYTYDYVLYTDDTLMAVDYSVIDNKVGDTYPSDHLPVIVKLGYYS